MLREALLPSQARPKFCPKGSLGNSVDASKKSLEHFLKASLFSIGNVSVVSLEVPRSCLGVVRGKSARRSARRDGRSARRDGRSAPGRALRRRTASRTRGGPTAPSARPRKTPHPSQKANTRARTRNSSPPCPRAPPGRTQERARVRKAAPSHPSQSTCRWSYALAEGSRSQPPQPRTRSLCSRSAGSARVPARGRREAMRCARR
eukprot:6214123-Pleurochrysis_carterae.AAC.3